MGKGGSTSKNIYVKKNRKKKRYLCGFGNHLRTFFPFLICARDGLQGTMKREISDKLFFFFRLHDFLVEWREMGGRGKRGAVDCEFFFSFFFSCVYYKSMHILRRLRA